MSRPVPADEPQGGAAPRLSGMASRLPRAARIVWRAVVHHAHDHCGIRAAAIAYYALLSFFPFVLLVAVGVSMGFDDPGETRQLVSSLRPFLPFLRDDFWFELLQLVDQRLAGFVARRGWLFAAAVAALFLIASQVSAATMHAVNVIFRTRGPTHASALRRLLGRARAFFMTAVVLLAMAAVFVGRGVLRSLEGWVARLPQYAQDLVHAARVGQLVLPTAVIVVVVYLLFRRLPQAHVAKRWALLGAALFAVGHDVALWAYGDFVAFTMRQGPIYGSFVGLVSLTAWVFWLSTLLLFCAEVIAILNGNREDRG